mgnify:CR=1 FL=1
MAMTKQFGGKLTKALAERYANSAQWKQGKFYNAEATSMDISFQSMPKLLFEQFFKTKGRNPPAPLPVEAFDSASFLAPRATPKFIWYGHSAVLMRWKDKTIFIDPMMGPNASPIAPFKTKRFSESTLDLIDDLPPIDLVLMTHDHYDHLDLESIRRLRAKTDKWYVALGVGKHLEAWGIDGDQITEFDWWDTATLYGLEFHFTPSRHFSGRGLTDRATSLWGGWVVRSDDYNLYWSGDGGYGDHFKAVGEKFGPFDIGFMECGQYNEQWHQIHMYPEEAVQAALDAKVQVAVPVHWGGFALSLHTWKDPAERFSAAAQKRSLSIQTPSLGSLFSAKDQTSDWWT